MALSGGCISVISLERPTTSFGEIRSSGAVLAVAPQTWAMAAFNRPGDVSPLAAGLTPGGYFLLVTFRWRAGGNWTWWPDFRRNLLYE
jgi:hypothetical protein